MFWFNILRLERRIIIYVLSHNFIDYSTETLPKSLSASNESRMSLLFLFGCSYFQNFLTGNNTLFGKFGRISWFEVFDKWYKKIWIYETMGLRDELSLCVLCYHIGRLFNTHLQYCANLMEPISALLTIISLFIYLEEVGCIFVYLFFFFLLFQVVQ